MSDKIDAQVYNREYKQFKSPCEKELHEVFSHVVVDSNMGWGEILCATTSSKLAHLIADTINDEQLTQEDVS